MEQVGSYQAKTHLPELLRRAAEGERIAIARHGKILAILVPPPTGPGSTTDQAIAALRDFRSEHSLGRGLNARILIDGGPR
jgi:antitoxin (DNA-binding transcriptional repressor) of toxin-antitoxin stability system